MNAIWTPTCRAVSARTEVIGDRVTLKYLQGKGIEAYIATGKVKHNASAGKPAAVRGRIPKDATELERMARKLRTRAGRAVYSKRKHIVEPVFGQIKHTRGFGQLSLGGLDNVSAEWTLICLTHNLLKLWRSLPRPPAPA